ncbi:MAG: hypothetical protein L6R41_001190 [Letrouitia leprolyta]|nr:MAG: hypothetical protein L6R41_001190 [Letrouitia leprolyta]
MAASSSSPQRRRSECPQPSSSIKPTDSLLDSDYYKMMVLHFSHDTTEEEVDRQFLRTALNLGINVPQDPKTTLELVTKNVSALELTSPSDFRPPPSSTSNSTHPTSCSSSEQRGHTKTSSLTSASMTSAPSSIHSDSSQRSSYTKIKRGMQRISTLRRRKTFDGPVLPIPLPIAAIKTIRPPHQHHPATIDQYSSNSFARKPTPAANPETAPASHTRVPSTSADCEYDDIAARQRSTQHPQLKRLRWAQLDEQRRFIRFEADQRRVMQSRQTSREQKILDEYPQQVNVMKERHAEALASLEQRHLSAEVDLEKKLNLERQACDTRLKHMQAYCNPRSTIEGMPNRVVTKQHHRQLEQQYHVRNGMGNLHTARINVLREKQGKQLERIMAKQELELKDMEKELAWKMQQLDSASRADEELLQREFSERRKRLTSRWSLAEAIERKKLENETGEKYAPLPPIEWEDPHEGTRENEESVDGGLLQDARMAYDAATLNMI